MRRAAVVVDAVALVQDLGVAADLHLQSALHDEAALLAFMARELDVAVLGLLGVFVDNIQRLGDAVLEVGRHVVVDHAVRLLDLLALARPRERVGAQRRAAALDEVGDVDAEAQRAPVEKREVQVAFACLAELVVLLGDAGAARHLAGREAGDLAQLADALGHLADFEFQSRQLLLLLHGASSRIGTKKSPSQRNDSLRRACKPAVPLKLHPPHGGYPLSGSNKP